MFSNNSKIGSFYGISMVPREFWKEYGYALLIIAGADGYVSDLELEWLTIEVAESIGADEDIISQWEEYDYYDGDLKEVISQINARSIASFSKVLIYDAIRMCGADNDYAAEEREHVGQAAALLKISQESVTAIEALIELETAASKMRSLIL